MLTVYIYFYCNGECKNYEMITSLINYVALVEDSLEINKKFKAEVKKEGNNHFKVDFKLDLNIFDFFRKGKYYKKLEEAINTVNKKIEQYKRGIISIPENVVAIEIKTRNSIKIIDV